METISVGYVCYGISTHFPAANLITADLLPVLSATKRESLHVKVSTPAAPESTSIANTGIDFNIIVEFTMPDQPLNNIRIQDKQLNLKI